MNPPMDCPRCGQAEVTEPACPRCGVVFAKMATARPRPAPSVPAPSAHETTKRSGIGVALTAIGLAFALVAGLVGLRTWQKSRARPTALNVAERAAPEGPPLAAADEPPPPLPPAPAVTMPMARVESAQVGGTDREKATAVARQLSTPSTLTAADIQAIEEMLQRHPDEPAIRDLLEALLLSVAGVEEEKRQYPQAIAHLQRAALVQPSSARPHVALTRVFTAISDWPAMEVAARAIIALDARSLDAWRALGFALMRQDRNREAMEALRTALDIRDDSITRGLLERIQRGVANESGMAERNLSHFHVRYDGEEHEGVGREILRALERHFATLVITLDHTPPNPIPVILFTREGYYNASGAPAWAGGSFDGLDGRIRVPIGGLTTSLTPDMDGTLIHELTHAFINDRTRGVAPRQIHEGLAQYMEGKRLASMLKPEHLEALADGRIGGVSGLYLGSLSFVEHLMALRGQGGMNDLLRAMGETGNVDEAFRQVHGTTMNGSVRAWAQRLRQQHGS